MNLQSSYSVVVTEKLTECRDFYTGHFAFEVVFEASWFVYLASSDGLAGVAFMSPDHPSRPPGPEMFTGDGVLLTLQVGDATAEYERLTETGLTMDHPLADEAWGQRRFGLRDPAGVWVDVVEQIEPALGFWDRYTS